MPHPQDIEDHAERLYTVYCHAVGGKAYDGRPLPAWAEFSTDPGKQTQANGWRALGELVANDPRLDEARATNVRLHRRAQTAEAAAGEWREVAKLSREQRTGRFFPALAALAVVKAEEENEQQQKRIAELQGSKSHMDYCRTLVPLEDGDVLADGIERLKKRIAELERMLAAVDDLAGDGAMNLATDRFWNRRQ